LPFHPDLEKLQEYSLLLKVDKCTARQRAKDIEWAKKRAECDRKVALKEKKKKGS
jgi:hypothetical protein